MLRTLLKIRKLFPKAFPKNIRRVVIGIFSLLFIRKGRWPFPKGSIKKILVIRNDYLGDMVIFLPTLKGICEGLFQAKIYLWTSEIAKELLEGSNLVDEFIIFDVHRLEKEASLLEILRLIRDIRKEKFDLVICTSTTKALSQFIGFLSGAPYRLGFDNAKRNYLFNRCLSHNPKNYDWKENLKILDALEIIQRNIKKEFDFCPEAEDKIFVNCFLSKNKVSEDDLVIGFNLGTKQKAKLWEPKKWADLAIEIHKRYKAKIIIFGGIQDRFYADKVLSYLNTEVIDSTGKINIKQLSLLIKRCSLFISHDSGPMHLAVALGVPTIALFGKSEPKRWGYPEDERFRFIQKSVSCRPCGKIECEDNLCMKKIEVDDILRIVEDFKLK